MLLEYENVFTYIGPENELNKLRIRELPYMKTEVLIKRYKDTEGHLLELRMNEPARKRSKKGDYRLWVERVQDDLEYLRRLAEELELRQREGDPERELYDEGQLILLD